MGGCATLRREEPSSYCSLPLCLWLRPESAPRHRSFWIGAFEPARTLLDRFASQVFWFHVKRLSLAESLRDFPCAGAEFWVQRRGPEQAWWERGMDWHFDKDGHFEHRQHIKRSFGGRLDLGTVTYLSSQGAPLVVLSQPRLAGPMSLTMEDEAIAFIVCPFFGRHVAFDGRLLHGCPARFAPKAERRADGTMAEGALEFDQDLSQEDFFSPGDAAVLEHWQAATQWLKASALPVDFGPWRIGGLRMPDLNEERLVAVHHGVGQVKLLWPEAEGTPFTGRLSKLMPMKFEHRCLQWLDDGHASLMLDANENQELEELRQEPPQLGLGDISEVMARRDSAIVACIVEIVVSAAAMALYDLRRTLLVPLANSVLIILASVGLHGALRLELVKVQAHGIVTTGLLIACLGNFLCEAVTGSLKSMATMALPPQPVRFNPVEVQELLEEVVTLYTNMRNTCAKMVNKELVDAGEQGSAMVLDVVSSSQGQLNGLNLATAFHRLARCTTNQQIPEVLLSPLQLPRTEVLTAKCSIMILWSLASLETFPTDLFALLSQVAIPKLRNCEVHDITNLLWSFAKLYKLRPDLVQDVAVETPLVVNTAVDALSQHDLSGLTVQLLISALVSEVAKKWDQIPKKSRSHVAFSFRLMRLQNCLLANSVAKTVTQICPDMHASVSRPRKNGKGKMIKGNAIEGAF
eukprot:g31234.t2